MSTIGVGGRAELGIGVPREFGAVIAAISFAGRSARALAARLGSMKMNQEVDAMQVMGIDLFDRGTRRDRPAPG